MDKLESRRSESLHSAGAAWWPAALAVVLEVEGCRGQLDPDSGQPAQREEAGLQTGAGDRSVSSGTACSFLLCFLDLLHSGS